MLPLFDRLENHRISQAVRRGLVLTIPALVTGSCALLLTSLPIPAYTAFIQSALGGRLFAFLDAVRVCSFDFLSILLLLTISRSYAGLLTRDISPTVVSVVSLCSFLALSGAGGASFALEDLGTSGMFVGLVTALAASRLFIFLASLPIFRVRMVTDASDADLGRSFGAIIPGALVVGLFVLLGQAVDWVFHVQSLQALMAQGMDVLFSGMGRGLSSGLLFILMVQLLWFFGIHGGNVMRGVATGLFSQGLALNMEQAAADQAPTEIFSKTFFDTFVLMGGCGTALCLVLAILLFARGQQMKRLALVGLVPCLFNINEMLIFGVPVVLNPILAIPFVLAPLLLTLISYLATLSGLVPYVTAAVEWTTPVFLSGYAATGSLAGSVLQLVNLVAGTALYLPFIRLYEKKRALDLSRNIQSLTLAVEEAEALGTPPDFQRLPGQLPTVAQMLAADLDHAIGSGGLTLHFQPQVNHEGYCFGAEALLRWSHPAGAGIPASLVVALAREWDLLPALERWVARRACRELREINSRWGEDFKLSINITADSLRQPDFEGELARIVAEEQVVPSTLWLELTEQTALSGTAEMTEKLIRLKAAGHRLIIDDFGMGYTSLLPLQNNHFDMVKLDGSLVRQLLTNGRTQNIVATITQLGHSLDFTVLAEFVETRQQQEALERLGCRLYQGYLFGKPMPMALLLELLTAQRELHSAPLSDKVSPH